MNNGQWSARRDAEMGEYRSMRHALPPWHVTPCNGCGGWRVVDKEDTLLAIVATSTAERRSEPLYNAWLMAAAAEMADALEELVDACEWVEVCSFATLNMSKKLIAAKSAIAKARGRF